MRFDPKRYQRLSLLLDQALDLSVEQREVWLQNLPPESTDLHASLRRMFDHRGNIETRDYAKVPAAVLLAVGQAMQTSVAESAELQAGKAIGPYRLTVELGHGGMGSVWLADRIDGKLKRQVALKFPYAGPQQLKLAERLRHERDILASLEHANIGRLYDADVTASGQPYLVLEYIAGIPIDQHCDQNQLTIRQRLSLFLQVLSAVQYAHTRLVIHRDLKPSNILIASDGSARLLDFGIAKLISQADAHNVSLTRFGTRVLTPDFASPEQITGGAVTTASDIYSLGVILYVLLSGRAPYRLKRNSMASLEEAIIEANIVPPSRAAISIEAAKHRAVTPQQLARQLRGDLDTVVLKALGKNVNDRYASVDALARDIEHSLRDEPVDAQPHSRRYLFKKLYLRNKLVFGASVLVILSLVGGIGGASWQAARARANESRAIAAAETSDTIKQFLIGLFKANTLRQQDPAKARSMNALDLLEAGADRVAVEFKDNTPLHRELLSIICTLLAESRSGAYKKHALEYVNLLAAAPDSGLERARVYLELSIQEETASVAGSVAFVDDGLKALGASADPAHRNIRAQLLLQRTRALDETLTSDELSKVYLAAQQLLEPDFQNTAEYGRLLEDMGVLEIRRDRIDQAVSYLDRALRATQNDPTAYDRSIARIQTTLAWGYQLRKQYAAAEILERRAGLTFEKSYGQEDSATAYSHVRLGFIISLQNRFDEALSLQRSAVKSLEQPSPQFNLGYLTDGVYRLAMTLVQAGRLAEADEVVRRLSEMSKNDPPRYQAEHLQVISDYDFLKGRYVAAEHSARHALELALKAYGPSSTRILAFKNRLGTRLFEIGKFDEAAALATQNLANTTPGTTPFNSAATSAGILQAKILAARGQAHIAADRLKSALEQFAAQPADRQDPNDEVAIRLALGRAYLTDHQLTMALPEFERALALRRTQFIGSPRLAEVQTMLAECKFRLGDRDGAQSLLLQAKDTLAVAPEAGRQYQAMISRLAREMR